MPGNKPSKLTYNAQANTLRDERGFVADCNGMPPHYRALFEASPDLLEACELARRLAETYRPSKARRTELYIKLGQALRMAGVL